jgi:hypothetical protein
VAELPGLLRCRADAAVDAAEAGDVMLGEDEDVAAERRLVQSGAPSRRLATPTFPVELLKCTVTGSNLSLCTAYV